MLVPILCLVSVLGGDAAKNLLHNGDFEEGSSKVVRAWDTIWPATLLAKSPEFTWTTSDAHGGKGCATLRTSEAKGYSSFTQEIVPPPKHARSAHLEGWVRYEAESGSSAAPSLMLIFYDPAVETSSVLHQAALPAGAKGWTKLSVDAAVPEDAKAWMVRCGTTGIGTVSFDDVRLTASDASIDVLTLLCAHGDYRLTQLQACPDPWIEFSFPFPFEGQTPLALHVSTKPERVAKRLEIVADRENRYLRVHLAPSEPSSATDVRLDAFVMVRPSARGDGKGVALVPREKLPKDVAYYFQATKGVDTDDAGIRAVAKDVRTTTMADAVSDVLAWMRNNFKYEGGGDQGAKASFERKNAVCTGHANLAASLFQAAGVPCRILGCLIGARLQEHYIVEVWAPKEGWRRVESTSETFPIPDDMHLILHVADPSFERSVVNVPLRLHAADHCRADYRMGDDHCWQGMTNEGSVALDEGETLRLEMLARAAFAGFEKSPFDGSSVCFCTPSKKDKPLSDRAREVASKVAKRP